MIAIIGAGPIGSYTAYLLSKQGKDVSVFEDHKEIGLPVHCTGITTSVLKDIIKIPNKCIINEIKKARIFSPNNKYIEISFSKNNIILDRFMFDNNLADIAREQGAKFFTNHQFLNNKNNAAIIKDKENKTIKKVEFDHLIGADGPLSNVAKANKMYNEREFWHGIQVRAKIKNDNIVEFYPYFGTYAWLVPEDEETARIGLAAKRYSPLLFRNFVFKYKGLNKKSIIEYQSGLIPKYKPAQKTQKDDIYLVGDAACQVKATTGGGIVPGMIAAESLVDSIINKKRYETVWRKRLGKDLYLHLLMRNLLDRFTTKDWDNLIDIMNSEEAKEILGKNERDNIIYGVLQLAIKKPSLIQFMRHLVW